MIFFVVDGRGPVEEGGTVGEGDVDPYSLERDTVCTGERERERGRALNPSGE